MSASAPTSTASPPRRPPRAPTASVLVGFADALAAPEAVASLLGASHRVTAFARRGRQVALRRLREVEIVDVTAPEDDLAACVGEVTALAAVHELTMPLDDPAVLLVNRGLPGDAPVAGPRGVQARLALDKRVQLRAAQVAGFAVPPWVELTSDGGEVATVNGPDGGRVATVNGSDGSGVAAVNGHQPASGAGESYALKLPNGWEFPAVLKPALAAEEHEGRLRRLAPRPVATAREARTLLRTWGAATPALAQRWVAGGGAGIFGIADDEGVHHLSAHRRVRMMNPAGSGSSACASAPVPAELRGPCGATAWRGGAGGGCSWWSCCARRMSGGSWSSTAVPGAASRWRGGGAASTPRGPPRARSTTPRRCRPPPVRRAVVPPSRARVDAHAVRAARPGSRTWRRGRAGARPCARCWRAGARTAWYNLAAGHARAVPRGHLADRGQPRRRGRRSASSSRTIRAAFHVHSEWSYDARLPLEEIAALFGEERCDAVFMCEHDRGFDAARLEEYVAACAAASVAGPLLVPGIEYAGPDDRVHVPVWGAVPFLGECIPTTELLRAVAAHDGAAVLAHPVRRDAWRVFEREWLELSAGIEIWTRKWDGWAPNPRACRWVQEHGLVGVAALDLHRAGQTFPLAMELQIDVPGDEDPLSVEACVAALREGRCRALIGGRPVAPLTHGGLGAAARNVERVRRPVWRQGRRVRERLHESGRSLDSLRG